MRICLVLLFAMFSVPFGAQAQDYQVQDYKAEIKSAETLGQMIYEQDIAGWVATDELLSDKTYVEKITPNLKGWVSLKDRKNYKTVFIGIYEGTPKAIFEVSSRKRKVKSSQKIPEGRLLSDNELSRWNARQKVIGETFEHCPEFTPMNTIVIPVPDDPENRLYSYLFSASQQPGVIVFGKHYRFTLSQDASEVLDKRDFSKSCIGIPRPTSLNAAGALISHIMRPSPEEHHVFANLVQQLDIYVTIPETEQLWKVSEGKISKVKQ
ncbi:MAG: hypothetical protein ABJN69_01965 [Hellea sp.]